jgi:hypothetical protein
LIVGQNIIKPPWCTTYLLVIPSKPIDAKDGANANITKNFSNYLSNILGLDENMC